MFSLSNGSKVGGPVELFVTLLIHKEVGSRVKDKEGSETTKRIGKVFGVCNDGFMLSYCILINSKGSKSRYLSPLEIVEPAFFWAVMAGNVVKTKNWLFARERERQLEIGVATQFNLEHEFVGVEKCYSQLLYLNPIVSNKVRLGNRDAGHNSFPSSPICHFMQ